MEEELYKRDIKGYCFYCKDEIEDDDFVESKGEIYHKDCFVQMNTHADKFDIEGDNV